MAYGLKMMTVVRPGQEDRYKNSHLFEYAKKHYSQKIVSQETRDKISKANKGRIKSQEECDKISKANKGKPKSEEHKHNQSIAMKGKTWADDEERVKQHSERQTGSNRSAETKEKMGAWQRGLKRGPLTLGHKQKISDAHKGKPLTDYQRQCIIKSNKTRVVSDETKRKISESLKKRNRERKLSINII